MICGFQCRPVPVLNAVDSPRRPVTGTTSVSLLFLSFILKNLSCRIQMHNYYLYNFLSCIIVCYIQCHGFDICPHRLSSALLFGCGMIVCYNYIFVSFRVYDNYADQLDIDIFLSRRQLNRKFQPTLLSSFLKKKTMI